MEIQNHLNLQRTHQLIPISNYALNKLLCEKILKFYNQKNKKKICFVY